ncbi:Na+/H+ antiporter NhaD/arsenite permease-like protein [Algoriphagus iocasae]|uniref:Na+/H+ antiporter NhaD/arsenite permease-like protein n=1 Tax=Algoriphagus iocasae TaxID=1836499 RepID=A0A841MV52_9BACT|nr:sodium:proton antiporter [Algoriphagus iocasae]MBB6326365.1 Na+/H+ antiporter NhaD/arsenite permease-like protein [Algoriphagus iocasae]
MKNIILSLSILFGILFLGGLQPQLSYAEERETKEMFLAQSDQGAAEHATVDHVAAEDHGDEAHHVAPAWLVIPFVVLLLMIATGPLFYEHFWHKNYPKIAIGLAILVVFYYLFILQNVHAPVHAMAEYIQFIALLASLYIASGGILIEIDKKATPFANVSLLLIGALISNLIGTTGASMLLIRPFIRLNKGNIQAYHIIFFIFMVSNVGGSLTPIGDPPLFLGFLKGIPFFWTLEHNWPAWIFALSLLAVAFYFIDKKLGKAADDEVELEEITYTNKFSLIGMKNFGWLFIIICSVFLDPNVIEGVPAIVYDGQKFSYLREVIMLTVAFLSYRFADKRAIQGNEFNFEPIREVAFIFIGIFGTMMPALELVGNFAKSPEGASLITHNTLYWGTGTLSGFLDNAPTYLNFLAAAMASKGADINNIEQVRLFAADGFHDSAFELMAIAVASVFFGAMTYIGNGPNFMVKSIAEQSGIKMPSFFGYIIRFSLPVLLPILILVWLVFFAFVG